MCVTMTVEGSGMKWQSCPWFKISCNCSFLYCKCMYQRNQLTNLFLLLVMKTYSFRNTDHSPHFIPASEEYGEYPCICKNSFSSKGLIQSFQIVWVLFWITTHWYYAKVARQRGHFCHIVEVRNQNTWTRNLRFCTGTIMY